MLAVGRRPSTCPCHLSFSDWPLAPRAKAKPLAGLLKGSLTGRAVTTDRWPTALHSTCHTIRPKPGAGSRRGVHASRRAPGVAVGPVRRVHSPHSPWPGANPSGPVTLQPPRCPSQQDSEEEGQGCPPLQLGNPAVAASQERKEGSAGPPPPGQEARPCFNAGRKQRKNKA